MKELIVKLSIAYAIVFVIGVLISFIVEAVNFLIYLFNQTWFLPASIVAFVLALAVIIFMWE